MTLHLDGKDYVYEYPALTNVADAEDCLDVRNLVGEQRQSFLAWLAASGVRDEALRILRDQHDMFACMRDECYDAGRYWWADPDTAARHYRADQEAKAIWAEIQHLERQA